MWAAVLAAATLVASCTTGGGSPSAPGADGASPSVAASAAAASPAAASPAIAYPEAPITIVVPFAAGGPTDTVTRLIAEPMSATLGQQVIVQNVAGAGGTLAAGQVATAAPDGYTVLMHHIGMSTAPSLYADLPYDPLVDFKTIGLVTEVPMTIIGRKDFEPTTLQELVDYVKANQDTVTYANAGIGAASHLCGLLFMNATDTKLTEVPYDGTGPAMEDLVGSQVDFMCDQTTNTTEQITAGTVKPYVQGTGWRLPKAVRPWPFPDTGASPPFQRGELELRCHTLFQPISLGGLTLVKYPDGRGAILAVQKCRHT